MIAQSRRSRNAILVYAIVICALIAPRFIASPPDVQAPEKERAAQPSDGRGPAAVISRNDADGRDLHDQLLISDIKVATVPVTTSNVGADATSTALRGSDPAQPPTKAADAIHESLSPSGAPDKGVIPLLGDNKSELLPEAGPALAGHVINISQDAGGSNEAEAAATTQQGVPTEEKPEQPPTVCFQEPFKCLMTELQSTGFTFSGMACVAVRSVSGVAAAGSGAAEVA